MDNLWTEYTLENRVTYFWQIGIRQLWVMHKGDEWLVATRLLPEEEDKDSRVISFTEKTKPEDLTWQRILCGNQEPRLRLMPRTPDRPVVVGSEYPVTIMPRNQGVFFVLFRSWLDLQVGQHFKTSIKELSTIDLSNSWFGDFATGISCYALKTFARRTIKEENIPIYKIICPVRIVNHSQVPLEFQRICVHVEHLKIYSSGGQLWSNEVRMLYQGPEKGSILKYSENPPEQLETENLTLMTDYRTSPRRNLLKRSLSLIRNLADFNGD